MFHPVNPGWKTRPGWSEFGAPRPNGAWRTHRGFDYYVPRGTSIFASGDGTVVSVGYNASGYGHYCTVRYAQYTILVGHFLARPTVSVGQRVNARTQLGVVGQSGNAAGIQWNGLIHPHLELRPLSGGVVDPMSVLREFDRSSLAGGGGTPISPEEDDEMKIIQPFGGDARAAIGTGFGYVFSTWDDYVLFCNVYGIDPNAPTQKIGDASVSKETARRWFDKIVEIHRVGSAPPQVASDGSATDLKPVLDAIAKVPTAAQNGQAARDAIVK